MVLYKVLFFVHVGYSTWLPGPIICSDWLKFQRSSSLKLMNWLNPNCKWMIIGMSFTRFLFFMWIGNPRWPPPQDIDQHWTYGKMFKCLLLRNYNMIKAKLYMNVHWMVLYKLKVFCSDMKFKMAATAGLSLTLDPMGKMFQNASSLKPLGQLKPNCPEIIIWRSSKKFEFFMPIRNPKWLPPQDID